MHTNLWVPFVIASIDLLKPGGSLGMVIPNEILNLPHAKSLRSFVGFAALSLHGPFEAPPPNAIC